MQQRPITAGEEEFLKRCMSDIQATVALLSQEAESSDQAMAIVSELVRHAIIVAKHVIPHKDPNEIVAKLASGK